VPLKILTRSYRGDERISTIDVAIPANATGSLSVLVSDGRQLNTIEQREMRRTVQPQSAAQLIRLLNRTRRNNRIYVRLLTGAPGAVVNGEALTALPPSVLSVLEADRNGGSFSPIRSAAIGEYEIPLDVAVAGSRTLTIDVAIPANAAGSLSILGSDGRQLNAIEQREMRRTLQPQSAAQLIRVLNRARRNNRIYIRLMTGAPGAVVNGEALTALPPSVLSVLEADRNGGSFSPIRSAAIGEYEVPMDVAVVGARTLTIDIDAKAGR
jgi:hypothetical protein